MNCKKDMTYPLLCLLLGYECSSLIRWKSKVLSEKYFPKNHNILKKEAQMTTLMSD
jgi:hypothetical protein